MQYPSKRATRISVVLANATRMSCQLLSRGLKRRGKGFNVLGCSVTAQEFLKQVTEKEPDIALISASLQDGPTVGLKVLGDLKSGSHSTRAILLLDSPDRELIIRAFSEGAKGVLCRSESFEALCKCIHSVHAGQIWANTSTLQFVLDALPHGRPLHVVDAKGVPLLTKREEEIVCMVAEGLTNHGISSKLGLSAHTVKNHLFRIYEKLGISSRVELVLYVLSSREESERSSIKR